jgi:hypothetical protein
LPILVLSIQYSTSSSSQSNDQGDRNWKGRSQITLFVDDLIVYINNPQNFTRELLQLIQNFSKVAGHKINSKQISSLPLYNDKQAEKEIRETTPFTIAMNSIKYLGITLICMKVEDLYDKNSNP